jgi:hypothetical protein
MKKGEIVLVFVILLVVIFASCATQKDYTKFNSANPRSILIVPVVNRSVSITAPDYFLSTITIPVAEKGYYVFPVNMVKRLLENEGLSDADLVHGASTQKLCNLFGSDAVLYITIQEWDAKYLVLSTTVTVKLTYVIKDGKTDDILWQQEETVNYSPQSANSGNAIANLIVNVASAAVAKAAPNYIPLAQQANAKAFAYPGPGIPPGKYLK